MQGIELPWEINLDYAIYLKIYQSDSSFQILFELPFP